MVGAGESLVIPPNVPHGVVALEDTVVTDVFTPRREDWICGRRRLSAALSLEELAQQFHAFHGQHAFHYLNR